MGTCALLGGMPTSGTEMRIGSYEVEVDCEISADEFVSWHISAHQSLYPASKGQRVYSTNRSRKLFRSVTRPRHMPNLSKRQHRLRLPGCLAYRSKLPQSPSQRPFVTMPQIRIDPSRDPPNLRQTPRLPPTRLSAPNRSTLHRNLGQTRS
jgi:hypothetical protein